MSWDWGKTYHMILRNIQDALATRGNNEDSKHYLMFLKNSPFDKRHNNCYL